MPVIETGRLLKAEALVLSGGAAAFQFADIEQAVEQRCDEQWQAAQEQARRLILDAEAQAAQIRTEAWQLGHTTGSLQAEDEFDARVEAEVHQRVEERLRHLVPALRTATERLTADREQLLLQWESAAIRLSLTVAERIVRRELRQHPTAPRGLIADVLQLAQGASAIVLRLHPSDVQDIEAHSDDWRQLLSGTANLKVVPDAGITRGGCLLETPDGTIDGRIETQLARIADELLGES